MKTSYPYHPYYPENPEESQVDALWVGYGRGTIFLFIVMAFYLVIPVGSLPLIGLSLSAPILFLVALPVFLRPPQPWLHKYRLWIVLTMLIWLGIFTATISNGLISGGTKVYFGQTIALVQFAYWLLVFIITAYFVSYENIGERIAIIIAVAVFLLAALRLGEAVFGGAIGYWTQLKVMTQNSYGIQFSTFAPVLLSYIFFSRRQGLSMLAFLTLLGAVVINGSRSSWVALLVATILFTWMFLRTQPNRSRVIFVLLFLSLVASLGLMIVPSGVVSSINQRFVSFQQLDEDKSFAVREVMIRKGIGLFQQSPLIGVGINRWYKESTPLDVPQLLSYHTQEYFDARSSHNSYILFLAETGLVGSIPLGIFLAILAIRGYRAASNLARQGQLWALGIYAGFIGMSIHLWSLAGLTGTTPWFMYGLVAAIIVLEPRITKSTERKHAHRFSLSRSRSI